MTDVSKIADDYIKGLSQLGSTASTAPAVPSAPSSSGGGFNLASLISSPASTPAPIAAAPSGGDSSPGWGTRLLDLVGLRPLYATSNAISSAVAANEAGKGTSNPLGWVANQIAPGASEAIKASTAAAQVLGKQESGLTGKALQDFQKAHGQGTLADYQAAGRDITNPLSAVVRGLSGTQKGMPQDYTQDAEINTPGWLNRFGAAAKVGFGGGASIQPIINQRLNPGSKENDAGRAAFNFGLSMITDPLTYVGPGAIKSVIGAGSKVTRVVTGAAGKEAAKAAEVAATEEAAAKLAATPRDQIPGTAESAAARIPSAPAPSPDIMSQLSAITNKVNDGVLTAQQAKKAAADLSAEKDAATIQYPNSIGPINAQPAQDIFAANRQSMALDAKIADPAAHVNVDQIASQSSPLNDLINFRQANPATDLAGVSKQISEDAGKTAASFTVNDARAVTDIHPEVLAKAAAAQDAVKTAAVEPLINSGKVAPPVAPLMTPEVTKVVENAMPKIDATPGRVIGNAAQADMAESIMSKVAKTANNSGLDAAGRAEYLRTTTMQQLGDAHTALAAAGRYPVAKASVDDATAHALSYKDALQLLPKTQDIVFADRALKPGVNAKVMIAPHPNQIMAGMARAAELAYIGVPIETKARYIASAMNSVSSYGRKVAPDSLNVVAREMAEKSEAISARDTMNTAAYAAKDKINAQQMKEAAAAKLDEAFNNPNIPLSTASHDLLDVASTAKAVGKDINASDTAIADAALDSAKMFVAHGGTQFDLDALRGLRRIATDKQIAGNIDKIRSRYQLDNTYIKAEAHGIVDEVIPAADNLPGAARISNQTDARLQTAFSRSWAPVARRLAGKGETIQLKDLIRSGNSAYSHTYNVYRTSFLAPMGKWENARAVEAWGGFLAGRTDADSLMMTQAANLLFDTKDSFVSSLFRNNQGLYNAADVKLFNDALEASKLPITNRLVTKDLTLIDGAAHAQPADIAGSWKLWQTKDPVAMLDKVFHAASSLAVKSHVARDFGAEFGSAVKTAEKSQKLDMGADTLVAKFADPKLFYSAQSVEDMRLFERMLPKKTSFRGQKGTGPAFINNVVDPAMAIWKPYMTIIRLGHHVRNFVGETMASALDGVHTVTPYRKSMAMMQAAGTLRKEDAPGMVNLLYGKEQTATDILHNVTLHGGTTVPVSTLTSYQLANKSGILTSFRVAEDQAVSQGKGILDSLSHVLVDKNPLVQAAGHVAESYTHGIKLAHWSALMERKSFTSQYKSLEEASMAAANRVRRYHPDPQGLSPGEQKYMRRIMPFYSWMRQAAPVVLETMLTNPGRITSLPKASYAIAQATGMNPNSITDQFPANGQFPSYVKDGITGPLNIPGWGQTGTSTYNLGSMQEGVLGSGGLNGSIKSNIIGMLNPLATVPWGVVSGNNPGTGMHISDKSDYIDSSLPIINQISGISGESVTGTIGNLLGQTPAKGAGGGLLDPQRSVRMNAKEQWLNQSTLNFLTGLNITNIDTKSNARNAAREKAATNRGTL